MRALTVRKSAKLLVSRMTRVSLRWIGVSRSRISSAPDFRHAQEFRTDFQIRGAQRVRIYEQPHAVMIGHERDHAAAFDKAFGFAHRDDVSVRDRAQDFIEPRRFGSGYEKQMTAADLAQAAVSF